MYKKSIEKTEEIVRMYREGTTIRQIGIAVGSSEKTVKQVLLLKGVDSVQDRKDKLEMVVKYYEEGKSQTWMEQNLKMTRKTIRDLLKEKGVHYKSKSEQWRIRHGNTLNETVFDTITPESAYWIGMLYTDGHIGSGRRGYNIEFGLHEQDKNHLQKLLDYIESSNSIQDDKRGDYCRIRIGSQKIHESLQKLGFTNKKSWDAIPPECLKNNRDFWRGCIDGDGGIYNNRKDGCYQMSLCGTLDTICGFIWFCQNTVGLTSKKYPTQCKGKCLYQIAYYGQEVVKIAEHLYKDSTTYLDRKYNKYLEIIAQEQIML